MIGGLFMNMLEVPIDIPADKFEDFLKKIDEDFPPDKFPEIFIKYYETGEKVTVLGMGRNAECARQSIQSLEKIPSLKGKRKKLKILRTSKDRFILR